MTHLKEHVNLQYDCKICDATFSHKNSLTMHIREVHEEKKQVYKCHKCPSTFSYPKHLTKHFEESHTKMNEYILEVTEVQDEIIDMIDPNQIVIENTNTTSSVGDTEENSDKKSNSNDTDTDIDIFEEEEEEEKTADQSEQIIGIWLFIQSDFQTFEKVCDFYYEEKYEI